MPYTAKALRHQEPVPLPNTASQDGFDQFACFPNAVLREPPIRHRGDDPKSGLLSVFEFAVAGAILMWARSHELKAKRHKAALAEGQRKIVTFKPTGSRYKRQSNRSFGSYQHKQVKTAGQNAYEKGWQDYTFDGKLLVSKVTRSDLLHAAGVMGHPSSRNLQRLDEALVRLTKPVIPKLKLPPLVREIKPLSHGKVRLAIDAAWFPNKRFGKVLWPPPKSGGGAVVLALLLFLAGCNLRSRISIPLEVLYKRMGLTQSRPSHRDRAFIQALKAVNRHLARTSTDLDAEYWPRRIKVKYTWVGKQLHVGFVAADDAKIKARRREQKELEKEAKRERKVAKRIQKKDEEANDWYSEATSRRNMFDDEEYECDDDDD